MMGNATTLTIRNPEARRLAEEIAEATGESVTEAVLHALQERRARLRTRDREALLADILAIAKRASAHVKRPYLDHAELLYDENGLPK